MRRDHPRACGEQYIGPSPKYSLAGSSPRVRGAVNKNTRAAPCSGIIPARAGSSGPAASSSAAPRDHPRACGEQRTRGPRRSRPPGSSPRVRGAGRCSTPRPCARGIIPARAGSRRCWPRSSPTRWDHPRACGEQVDDHRGVAPHEGSSPRVRGAGRGGLGGHDDEGIIPARAGSSTGNQARSCCSWDHPRACGEQAMSDEVERDVTGSSPRVRGAASCMTTATG